MKKPRTPRDILNTILLPNGRRDGFTLVEILIVLAISAMISGFLVTYSKVSQRQISLYVEEQKIAELIFRAKSLAIATYNDPSTRRCGYGLDVNYALHEYSLFSYEAPGSGPQPDCFSVTSIPLDHRVILSTYVLNANLVFKSNPPPPDSLTQVLFVPPTPITLISTDDGASTDNVLGKIYLETTDGSANAAITVNNFGQIDF